MTDRTPPGATPAMPIDLEARWGAVRASLHAMGAISGNDAGAAYARARIEVTVRDLIENRPREDADFWSGFPWSELFLSGNLSLMAEIPAAARARPKKIFRSEMMTLLETAYTAHLVAIMECGCDLSGFTQEFLEAAARRPAVRAALDQFARTQDLTGEVAHFDFRLRRWASPTVVARILRLQCEAHPETYKGMVDILMISSNTIAVCALMLAGLPVHQVVPAHVSNQSGEKVNERLASAHSRLAFMAALGSLETFLAAPHAALDRALIQTSR